MPLNRPNGLKQKPWAMQPGQRVPDARVPFKIIIDVSPDGTQSTMNVQGGLNPMMVATTLSAQLNTLLPKMFTDMLKAASGLTGPNGQPILTLPPNHGKEHENPVPDTFQVQDMSEGPNQSIDPGNRPAPVPGPDSE